MKPAMLTLLMVLAFTNSPAHAGAWDDFASQLIFGGLGRGSKSGGNSGGGGGGSKDVKRYVLGAGVGPMREFSDHTINDKDTERAANFFYQSETALVPNRSLWLHLELSYMRPKAQAEWDGTANTNVEVYVMGGNLGLTIQIPTSGLKPFFGGGYFIGHSVVSNPATSERTGISKLGDKENKFIHGPVAFGGIDIGSKGFGIRTSFDYSWLRSDRYRVFAGNRLKYEYPRVGAGLYFSF